MTHIFLALALFIQGLFLPISKADPRIAQHLYIAKAMAKRFVPYMKGRRDFDELYAIALVGLWKATETHDENRSGFASYANRCVYNELEHEQRLVWTQKRRGAVRSFSLTNHDGEDIELLSSGPNPEQAYATVEAARAVLAASKPKNQDLVMAMLQGASLEDAAAIRGISREQARMIFSNACRSVQREVKRKSRRAA